MQRITHLFRAARVRTIRRTVSSTMLSAAFQRLADEAAVDFDNHIRSIRTAAAAETPHEWYIDSITIYMRALHLTDEERRLGASIYQATFRTGDNWSVRFDDGALNDSPLTPADVARLNEFIAAEIAHVKTRYAVDAGLYGEPVYDLHTKGPSSVDLTRMINRCPGAIIRIDGWSVTVDRSDYGRQNDVAVDAIDLAPALRRRDDAVKSKLRIYFDSEHRAVLDRVRQSCVRKAVVWANSVAWPHSIE